MAADDLGYQEVSLQHFLDFSDADLAANREGLLGPGQQQRLVRSGVWRLVVGPAMMIVFLALEVAVLSVPVAGVTLLLLFGFGLVLTWQGFAFVTDAMDGRVAFITAPLNTRVVSGKTTSYYADCGPVSKSIGAGVYEALPRGLTCHLYYAPGSRSLLSIEPSSDSEPKPAHPFGPDSAHVWDRIRISWVAVTVGVLGLVIAAHGLVAAQPAHPVPVEGNVSNYVETHGKGGYRHLFLGGDPNPYVPYPEGAYSPPAPPFETLTGQNVVLYVNDGTREVLAVNDGEQLYAYDWYLHPDHEKTFELALATVAGVISLLILAAGVVGIVIGPQIAAAMQLPGMTAQPAPTDAAYSSTPMFAMPSLYAPPSVRPWHASWVIVPVFAVAGAAVGLSIVLLTHK